MKFKFLKFDIKRIICNISLVCGAIFTSFDVKSTPFVLLDYIFVTLIIVILIFQDKLSMTKMIVIALFVSVLLLTLFTRLPTIELRQYYLILQIMILGIFVVLVSDTALHNFGLNFRNTIVYIIAVSLLINIARIFYSAAFSPYYGRINFAYSDVSNYHLYGFVVAMQFFSLVNLTRTGGSFVALLSTTVIPLIGARSAVLITLFTLLSRRRVLVFLVPISLMIVPYVDFASLRSFTFELNDASALGRLIKIKIAFENFDFINIFIGQSYLRTIYWDNLAVSLLVNCGFIWMIVILIQVYRKLRYLRFSAFIFIFSTMITEFYLVPTGLFWGLILPSMISHRGISKIKLTN